LKTPDDPASPAEAPAQGGEHDRSQEEFAELRELLLRPERSRIDRLTQRLDDLALDPQELADRLPEAISLRAGRDRQLARALAPTVERALSESVRRNPREIATAIFPVLGPAIRKAIAQTMAGLVQSINGAIEHSLSPRGIGWRVEAWRTGVPFAQIVIKRSLVYRVEQVFLIHADTGLLLAHVSPPELKVADADLVSGMLTAIQDFVSDSFQEEEEGGKLRTFSVGELSVLVEPGPRAVVAAVVRGQVPDEFVVRLQDTLETIHSQMGIALADFEGDTAPFVESGVALPSTRTSVPG
jgi:OOP family OmpA-OmpF porin